LTLLAVGALTADASITPRYTCLIVATVVENSPLTRCQCTRLAWRWGCCIRL